MANEFDKNNPFDIPLDAATGEPEHTISADDVKNLWKFIDRKLKRTTQDTEIIGDPAKGMLVADPEMAPLLMQNDKLNVLGNLTSKVIGHLMDPAAEEQNKRKKLNRYKALEAAISQPEGEGILNIYADEATTEDQDGETIHAVHANHRIVEDVEEMFDRLGVADNAWEVIFNMCGFGDEYYEVVPNQALTGIHQLTWLPREYIDRIEMNGILKGFKVGDLGDSDSHYMLSQRKYDVKVEGEQLIYPWRILHFRIPSSKYSPYGKSVLDNITSTLEQLNLMIKSMLIARVTRAPERRIYNVDVGTLQGEKAIKYANEAVGYLKKKKVMQLTGENAGRQDMIKDIFGATEDIVLPKRTGGEGNSIGTLDQIGVINVDDAEFIKDRIFPPVGIPRQYLYDDTFQNANTNLSSKSVPFAKKIKRVQRYYLQQLYKLCMIELKLKKYSNDEINELVLTMNNPSNIADKERIENATALWQLVGTIKQLNMEKVFYPDYLIYREFLKLSDEEIVELLKVAQLQQGGQNIFDFLPPSERPEGAEELQTQQTAALMGPEGMPGPGMAPGPGGMPGEMQPGAAPAALPGEISAALGPPPTQGPAMAEYIPPTPSERYTEAIIEALKRKQEFMKKIQASSPLLENIDVKESPEEIELQIYRRQKINLSYLENIGELGGFDDFVAKKRKKIYND